MGDLFALTPFRRVHRILVLLSKPRRPGTRGGTTALGQ